MNFHWNGQFPKKRNWFLRNCQISTPWVLFLDADEFVDEAFCDELSHTLPNTPHSGFWISYGRWFLGKRLRYGERNKKLALFRVGSGEYERVEVSGFEALDMEIHEHPKLSGSIGVIRTQIDHKDFRDVEHWLTKHNHYSTWEARRIISMRSGKPYSGGTKQLRRHEFKYWALGRWWLPLAHFLYNYIFRGGVLDGRVGLAFALEKAFYFFQIGLKLDELADARRRHPSGVKSQTSLRVLHTNLGIYPERGGPPSVIANLAAAQAMLGHAVTIASSNTKSDLEQIQRDLLRKVPGGDRVEVQVLPRVGIWKGFFGRPLSFGESPPDLIHIHELWTPFDLFIARSAKAQGIPYVVTMHGLLSKPRLRRRWLKKWLARQLWVRRMLRASGFVHGLTAHECLEAADCIGNLQLIQIPNGFSAMSLSDPADPPDHLSQLKGRRFVLFLSRLQEIKGPDLLVPIFEHVAGEFPDVYLVVAGPDEGSLSGMNKQRERSSFRDRIHFVGMADAKAKSWLLTNAELFILPSRDEGFSVAILEALSKGCPVVMTTECHFPEASIAGAALEAPISVTQLAEHVKTLLSSRVLSRQMGDTGREFVQKNYSWSHIAGEMISAYIKSIDRATSNRFLADRALPNRGASGNRVG